MGCPCKHAAVSMPELDKIEVVMKKAPAEEVDQETGEVSYVAPITSVSKVGPLTLDQWLDVGHRFHMLSVGCAALFGVIVGHCVTKMMNR